MDTHKTRNPRGSKLGHSYTKRYKGRGLNLHTHTTRYPWGAKLEHSYNKKSKGG